MEVTIGIATDRTCRVIVTDSTEYVDEDSQVVSKGRFKYSDTVSVDVLQLNATAGTQTLGSVFTTHDGDNEPIYIDVERDGWLTVNHVIVPTVDWVESQDDTMLALYDIVYFSDGEKVYKLSDGSAVEVEMDEVLEVNPDATTVSMASEDFISVCHLRQCYVDLCKEILNDRAFTSCFNDDGVDDETEWKRDVALMALNVIKYLAECEQFAEIQRLLETLEGCNGLCSSGSSSKTNGCSCGCGCHKQA